MEMKPGIQQTEVGMIPSDWNAMAVGDMVDSTAPICYGVVQVGPNTDDGVPIVAIKYVKEISRAPLHLTSADRERPYIRSRVKTNDVLISIKGTIGRVGIVPSGFGGNISRELARIRLTENIVPTYVAHQLENDVTQGRILRAVVGTTRLELSIATLRRFEIPLPPTKAEQEAIAEALSDADALIDSLEQLIAKKRQIKQGAMQELLTGKKRLPGFSGKWDTIRLGDIAEIIMGQSPSSLHYNSKGIGLPLIQGNADISDRKTIKRMYTSEISKLGLNGDILLSVRAPVGQVSRAVFDVCLGRGVCAIRNASTFLYHSLVFHEPNWANLSKGSTFDSVNSADVKAFDISLPLDDVEQKAIAFVLTDMDAEIDALDRKLAKARQIKQGMMQELLTGKIRLI